MDLADVVERGPAAALGLLVDRSFKLRECGFKQRQRRIVIANVPVCMAEPVERPPGSGPAAPVDHRPQQPLDLREDLTVEEEVAQPCEHLVGLLDEARGLEMVVRLEVVGDEPGPVLAGESVVAGDAGVYVAGVRFAQRLRSEKLAHQVRHVVGPHPDVRVGRGLDEPVLRDVLDGRLGLPGPVPERLEPVDDDGYPVERGAAQQAVFLRREQVPQLLEEQVAPHGLEDDLDLGLRGVGRRTQVREPFLEPRPGGRTAGEQTAEPLDGAEVAAQGSVHLAFLRGRDLWGPVPVAHEPQNIAERRVAQLGLSHPL